jgi:adenylate cyclase
MIAAQSIASAPPREDLGIEAELRRARILLDVAERCASINDLDGVLHELVVLTSRALECDRGTLFLNDPTTAELYSRVAQGNLKREIRILNTTGIAGAVFQTGVGLVIADPYNDPRFNASVDERTGYRTESIVCAPVRTMTGDLIGVMQSLNKLPAAGGNFTELDLELLTDMTRQAAIVLQSLQNVERIGKLRAKEMAFLELVSDINSEFDLSRLLSRAVREITAMLDAERATVFLHDVATDTLFSRVATGAEATEIRLPSFAGIAGSVFTSGASLNIPYAYADLRFNPAFDRQTGFFTRSILCVPIVNKDGRSIGVTQVLNKKGGVFSDEDEQRLKAFTAQIAIALENSKLFDDVQRVRTYNESMLQSMSNGVVTLDPAHKIITSNAASARIWEDDLRGRKLDELLGPDSHWVIERIDAVKASGTSDTLPDATVQLGAISKSVNLTIMPLVAAESDKELGSMLMFEDISAEKRMKSTMSRYIDPVVAAQMLEGDAHDLLGGISAEATIMFTDVRGFTTITEEYGAQGTVAFLNEYFTMMVDCITREGGMLDKFIGDAIMACFGLPIPHDDDPDRAARTAISMIRELWAWNDVRRAKGLKTVDMGVGLNTDMVVSGNIGSPKRMDYTLIGDGVNLASRLESACKAYSARILVGESTVSKLKGTYRLRDVDLVVVKGKTQPVKVFEMLDYHTAESFPNLLDVTEYFNDGIRAYRAAEWDKAITRFDKCLALNPGDGLSRTYFGRCEVLKATPPEGEWDGIWVMKDK